MSCALVTVMDATACGGFVLAVTASRQAYVYSRHLHSPGKAPVIPTVDSRFQAHPRGGRVQVAAIALVAITVLTASHPAHAARGEATGDPGHFGFVLEAAGEFGGDNLVEVFYRNGDSQNIKAGQGVTLGGGIHYRPVSFPVDFAATVGWKFVRTAAYNTDLGVDRAVIKLTGTVPLGNHFWAAAGPVWHAGTKLNGDGFIDDVKFDDAVGGMVSFGWRWIGVSYTNIKYRGSSFEGSVDASSVGVTAAWKF